MILLGDHHEEKKQSKPQKPVAKKMILKNQTNFLAD